jgi:hypothetical protein
MEVIGPDEVEPGVADRFCCGDWGDPDESDEVFDPPVVAVA